MPQHLCSARSIRRLMAGASTLLLASGVFAYASSASAQGEPPPPAAAEPAPPPPAAAEPAPPPPAAQPAPAEPAFTASFGAPGTTADTTTSPTPAPAEGEPKPLPWRGSTLTWNQAATTTAVGVGRDNIGDEDEYYGWEFVLFPNFYLVDEEYHKVTVFAEAGVGVEWTNSNVTTTLHEPYFKDLQIGVGYAPTFYQSEDKEWKTGGSLRLRLVFPTSPISSAQSRILTTALSAGVNQKLKLLGKDAEGLNSLTVRAGLTWSHLFAKAYTPVNSDLDRERQNASGNTILSDQLTSNSMDQDRLIPSIGFDLPLFGDLSLSTNFRLIRRFRHDFDGAPGSCDVVTLTGCVDASGDDASVPFDGATEFTDTGFDVSLSYPIFEVVDLSLGYYNETLGLAPDGQRRDDIFYSPDAQFFLDVVANLDVIYDKASGRSARAAAAAAAPTTLATAAAPSF